MTEVNINDLEEKSLYCKDCGDKFIWTPGEQKFFIEKGLNNIPKRCKVCTAKNRDKLRDKHPMWWAQCRVCHKKNEVPFEPLTDDILCEECFKKETQKRDQKILELGEKLPQ